MTIVKTEGQHKEEFLVGEGDGDISRESGTLTSGQKVTDGRVLSLVGGKLIASTGHLNTAGASDEVIVGILSGNYDASATGTNADIKGVPYIARIATYDASLVTYHAVVGGGAAAATAAVKAELKKLNLIPR